MIREFALVIAMTAFATLARADGGALRGPDGGAASAASASTAPPTPALEPEHRPSVRTTLTPTSGVQTGDLVTLTITADAREGDDVTVPEQSFAPFEIHRRNPRIDPPRDGRQRFVFTLELLALDPGEHALGPLSLRVVTSTGHVGIVSTDRLTIRVGSVLANEPNAQPKARSAPVTVMQDDYTLAYVGGSLLALLLAVTATLLISRWWRRRQAARRPPPPPRPAWDVALEKLETMRKRRNTLLEQQRSAEFVDGVSDAIREYLGARYGFVGLESTTDEIVQRLRGVDLRGVTHVEITAMLADCDLVKFAKATMDDAQCDILLAAGFRIVRATKPIAQTPPPPSAEPLR